MRKFLFLAFALSLTAPALAKPSHIGVAQAEARFNNLDVNTKATYQIMMTAAGCWAQIPRPDYSLRLFEDTQHFQSELGDPATGILTKAEVDKLFSLAIGASCRWRIRRAATRSGYPWGLAASLSRIGMVFVSTVMESRLSTYICQLPGWRWCTTTWSAKSAAKAKIFRTA
jgi:hypothetical protein